MSQQVRYRFGDFEFDPETGELHPANTLAGEPAGEVQILAPQPARLLRLLLERGGDLLSRDAIRKELWPETHIDFDSSLHFCIRKIRAALGDDAEAGRYIETLPRRGYRISVDVSSVQGSSATGASHEVDSADDSAEASRTSSSRAIATEPKSRETGNPKPRRGSGDIQLLIWALSIPLGLLGAGILGIMVTQGRLSYLDRAEQQAVTTQTSSVAASSAPLRLAILPFEVGIENAETATRSARLSEGLTAALTQLFADPNLHTRDRGVRILGPRSTAPYRELPFPKLEELRSDLGIDLVLNARIVEGGEDTGPGVEGILVELIDTTTRAHLWADFYPLAADWLTIETPIVDGVGKAVAELSSDSALSDR